MVANKDTPVKFGLTCIVMRIAIAVGAAVAIAFGISAIRALGSEEPMRAVMRGVNGAVEVGVWAFGVVTLLFVLAERFKLDMTWADKWDPKSLPREHVRQPKGLVETAFTLVFDVIFLLWWVKIVQFPNELPMRDGASAAIAFSPAWDVVWWPVLVLAVGLLGEPFGYPEAIALALVLGGIFIAERLGRPAIA